MKINFVEKLLGSGFYTGYIPFASGTFGSLAGLIIYFIPGFEKLEIIVPAIIIFLIYGIYVGSKFEKEYGKDPAECTIDEVVGMWISLLLLPKNIYVSVFAFLVWRALDIIKPSPARQAEKLKGGLGIMMDDVIAGIYSTIFVHIILVVLSRV
ncbi:MAG TPA: phosphatidylglycerophosphatase A [Ignavibacteriaceae bacterium]|nr:phosphatidylglycerophosphatase A [Ignavibacteriaceae bacterium]